MRLTAPKFDRSNPVVRDLLDLADTATTMAEAAYFQRLARRASAKREPR